MLAIKQIDVVSSKIFRFSSSPTFPYFLGLFLLFFYFFSQKTPTFLPWNSKIIFLIRKSKGCWRSHHLPYSFWRPRRPSDFRPCKNVKKFWFHYVYFTLFCNIQDKKKHVMLFLPQMNVGIYPKVLTFCHKLPTFLLLFSYLYIS